MLSQISQAQVRVAFTLGSLQRSVDADLRSALIFQLDMPAALPSDCSGPVSGVAALLQEHGGRFDAKAT